MKERILKDHTKVPSLGQGTWHLGEHSGRRAEEIAALRWGIAHGMTLIDTAEMYGNGASEELIGEAIADQKRENLYLVSKVYPWNTGEDHIFQACEDSLNRLGTDYLDLYLLHWRGGVPLEETVSCMEELKAQWKILNWGVSNFDVNDMEDLMEAGGQSCMVDQVLYHLGSRGIELKLMPWLKQHQILTMAYCPLAEAGTLRTALLRSPVILNIAQAHQCTPFQILLAFTMLDDTMITIPKASTVEHVSQNHAALKIAFSQDEIDALNQAFPRPSHVMGLDMQ